MLVRRFNDEYDQEAGLVGGAADEIRAADAAEPLVRWIVCESETVVGVASGRHRPDGRIFVRFHTTQPRGLVQLADFAAAEVGTIHAIAHSETAKTELEGAGFAVEVTDDEFAISFDAALRRLGPRRRPRHLVLRPPHELEEQRLVALDTSLRQDVPGTAGWVTTAEAWRDEIDSPEYDPGGYLIAFDTRLDVYAGLIRFWRNPDGPRLGLLAVTRPYRGSLLAAALLRAGLTGAGEWGSPTFQTSTSPDNRGTYQALVRLGATPTSRRYQMRYTQKPAARTT